MWCCHLHKTLFPKANLSGTFEVSLFVIYVSSLLVSQVTSPSCSVSFTVSQGFFRDPVIHWQLKYQLSFPLPFICTHDDGWKRIDLHSILSPAWSLTADHTPFNFTEIQWAQKLTFSILCFLFRVQLPRQKSAFRISLLPVIAIK